MKPTRCKTALLGGAALCALAIAGGAEAQDDMTTTLPEVTVRGAAPDPVVTILDLREDTVFPAADGGDLLQSVPGVAASRMGGHGLEPYIRGQKQGQINIIDDGAFVYGGCPNRMDPPASFLQLEGSDELIVEKGYATVQNGPGGSGGTVRTVRNAPVFAGDRTWSGAVSGGYQGNSGTRDLSARGAAGTETAYVRGNAEWKDAGNYDDGRGEAVRSAFEQKGARIDVGYTPTLDSEYRIGVQYERVDDALFAGAGMDSPLTENRIVRAALDRNVDWGPFDGIEASAFLSRVDHIMDNFTLRDRTGMGMLTDSGSDSFGLSLKADGIVAGNDLTVGTDLKWNLQDATRYMGAQSSVYGTANEHAFLWPDMTIRQIGLFAEGTRELREGSRLKAGLRYDNVHVGSDKVNAVAARTGQTPNQLYTQYYGVGADDAEEHNVGGLLRLEQDVGASHTVFAGVSRSVRTADATERGIAGSHAAAANRWIGRPDIDPEVHYQADLGITGELAFASWSGSVYYDNVQDYILRDVARGQDGVLLADGATIYRNVDATLAGFELGGRIELAERWQLTASLAYTYGENDEDDRPLAQIPPLQLATGVEYGTGDWLAGIRLRAAAKQDRADVEVGNNSGLDQRKTPGHAVVDLYSRVWAFAPAEVSFGVTNLFDRAYANHLNRASSFNVNEVQVNEPGRAFFVRLDAEF